MSRYRGGVQYTEARTAKWPACLMVASAAVLVTGCSLGEGMMAPATISTTEASPAGEDAQANAELPTDDNEQPRTLTLSSQQRGYLDAIKAAGVAPSSDLLALSIGSYVCQARAAKPNDQAVWNFVLPLVRSDLRAARGGSTPNAAEINAATADYIRVATDRLC